MNQKYLLSSNLIVQNEYANENQEKETESINFLSIEMLEQELLHIRNNFFQDIHLKLLSHSF